MNTEPVLREEQLAASRRDGFVFMPQIFGPRELARIGRWTEEVVAYPEVPGRHMAYTAPMILR